MARAWWWCALVVVAAAAASADGVQPNVVLVVVDDLGYGDVGWTADDLSRATPALQQLRHDGVTFGRFYCSPQCTPSRAELLTGRYSLRLGLQDSVIHGTEPRGLGLKQRILPQTLQELGYATYGVGKWHLGFHQMAFTPNQRGFDRFFGILTGGGDHYTHETSVTFGIRQSSLTSTVTGKNLWEDGKPVLSQTEGVHTTKLYSDKAASFITEHFSTQRSATGAAESTGDSSKLRTTKPMFLFLSFQAVHGPMQVDRSFVDGTRPTGCAALIRGPKSRAPGDSLGESTMAHQGLHKSREVDSSELKSQRGAMCGMVAMIDDGVDQVVKAFHRAGQWSQTVLFFLSDNGGVSAHGSSMGGLRGEKGEVFEGGVRVPALISGGFLAHQANHESRAHQRLAKQQPQAPLSEDPLQHGLARKQRLLSSQEDGPRSSSVTGATATPAASLPVVSTAKAHLTDLAPTIISLAGGDCCDKFDGVDLWEHVVTKAQVEPPAREEILLHRNSEMWGGGGAMIKGDYKFIVRNSVSDAVLYQAGRQLLDKPTDMMTLARAIDSRRKELFHEPDVFIFNVVKNPQERTDNDGNDLTCRADAEACQNLVGIAAFAEVEQDLRQHWKVLGASQVPSSEVWLDDGPLASPALFGGHWHPWRDDEGFPLAVYRTTDEGDPFAF